MEINGVSNSFWWVGQSEKKILKFYDRQGRRTVTFKLGHGTG